MEGSPLANFVKESMERSRSSPRVSAPFTWKRPFSADAHLEVVKSYYDYVKSRIRIGVEGYDTSLQPIELYRALESLFKACGEVHNIQIRSDPVTNELQRSCIVILRGEGAGDKALQLDGSDIGGKKIVVTSLPPGLSDLSTGLSTDVLAARHVAHDMRNSFFYSCSSEGVSVTGYATSLPRDDIKNALSNHFSTCGEITDVFLLNSRALVYFYGPGSNHRAVQLSGSDLGGCTLVVKALPYPKPKEPAGASGWTRLRYRFRLATLAKTRGGTNTSDVRGIRV
ncbi:PREDICTED: nucleolin 1-like isoform X1 [Brassica oleracea var. oleracea]|uniref:nucleolin 1-like isoform X1 n=1 Tax=Brassica oleracea var. oleracea TaxID=109376 RepID=UPI0006A6C9F5|nr:PREDICTED: nucleolin 1-like isoform X1 [Brassica oleracea var. oleracea]